GAPKNDQTAALLAELGDAAVVFKELGQTLGMFRQAPVEAAGADDELTGKLLDFLIELRVEAKKRKDFATADAIRARLKEMGITLEDRPGGTVWSR
ncbi:MAG: cysteine--tRNA ligase, partial [Planctomycetia bacterium]|nr:cysteine--tRNA ligase [Planctomycetia bacterium]